MVSCKETIVWCFFLPSCQSIWLGWVPTNTREASVLAGWALTSLASLGAWHVSPTARKKVLWCKRWILQFWLVRQDPEINTIHRCRSRGPAFGFYLCAYKVSSQLSIVQQFAAISLRLRGSACVDECTEAGAAILLSLEGQDEGPSCKGCKGGEWSRPETKLTGEGACLWQAAQHIATGNVLRHQMSQPKPRRLTYCQWVRRGPLFLRYSAVDFCLVPFALGHQNW